jgi:endonuclease/exonuclease/phosphatase (EEP) superfamily protein YafD
VRSLWPILVVVAACGEGRPPTRKQPAGPEPSAMRVMSYNVNFGIAGDVPSIEAIERANPDIVLLQETNEVWERAITDKLGARYAHRRFQGPTGTWAAGGMGILSRYPIVALDQLDAPGALFFAWRVVVDSKLGRIQLVNVHLRPPMSDGGSWVVGYFTTRADRLREIEHHLAALDPKLPTIIAGDFNEEGDGRAIERLKAIGFADALARHAGKQRTWEWPVGSMTLKFQLDHIMHDDHFIPVTAAVVEAGNSDHKPIWADFERMDP